MTTRAARHCGSVTCRATRSAADQRGRTCACSCRACNPARRRDACETCEGARRVECGECGGSGSTAGHHVQNCDVDDCPECDSDEECGECLGEGEVGCPDCGEG